MLKFILQNCQLPPHFHDTFDAPNCMICDLRALAIQQVLISPFLSTEFFSRAEKGLRPYTSKSMIQTEKIFSSPTEKVIARREICDDICFVALRKPTVDSRVVLEKILNSLTYVCMCKYQSLVREICVSQLRKSLFGNPDSREYSPGKFNITEGWRGEIKIRVSTSFIDPRGL